MKRSRWHGFCLAACLLAVLCGCGKGGDAEQVDASDIGSTAVQYDYQLKAGEPMEVYDVTFDKMVTVTVDPDSTRDAANNLRSDIFFDNCVFRDGLTIVGDYHAMITFGSGCSFDDGAVATCKEATPDAAKQTTLEDNRVKVFVACEGVTVQTGSAVGVLSDGPDVVIDGTSYSKQALAPDADFLGVYNLYEGDEMTYVKLAIGEDDSVAFLE